MTSVLFYKPERDLNELSRNEDKIIHLGNGEIVNNLFIILVQWILSRFLNNLFTLSPWNLFYSQNIFQIIWCSLESCNKIQLNIRKWVEWIIRLPPLSSKYRTVLSIILSTKIMEFKNKYFILFHTLVAFEWKFKFISCKFTSVVTFNVWCPLTHLFTMHPFSTPWKH